MAEADDANKTEVVGRESSGETETPPDLERAVGAAIELSEKVGSQVVSDIKRAERLEKDLGVETSAQVVAQIKAFGDQVNEESSSFRTRAERLSSPYVVSPELAKSLKVAQVLKRPLLLEGEPGTGKTSLAYALAGQEDEPIIHCRGKSTLTAQSVMYEIDYVARLNDAALAQAIPETMKAQASEWQAYLEKGGDPNDSKFQSFITGFESAAKFLNLGKVSDVRNYITYGELGEAIIRASRGERVVLLFDEIDKAKREFPNDLLDELEHMTMRVRETGEEVSAPKENVTVIVTSNHERDLPEPFLRRCVYNYLEFPKPDQMTEIVKAHIPDVEEQLLSSAVARFYEIRQIQGIQKQPSTSEMLDWMKVLIEFGVTEIKGNTPLYEALLKVKEDRDLVMRNVSPEADMPDEYSILEAYKMDRAAVETLRGNLVFKVQGEAYYDRQPDVSLVKLLVNNNFRVIYKNQDREGEDFDIALDGLEKVGNLTFSIGPSDDGQPSETAQELYALLEKNNFVKSKFVAVREPVVMESVETSNNYFVRGKDASGKTVYKTDDGRYIYEVDVTAPDLPVAQ